MDNSYQPVIESLRMRIESLISKYESVSAENTQLRQTITNEQKETIGGTTMQPNTQPTILQCTNRNNRKNYK